MTKHQSEFMAHRRQQEKRTILSQKELDSPMASLMTVEFNTTELCNRTCVFCPRVNPEIYPNRKLHLTAEIVDKASMDLQNIGFTGRISFSGFGEPVLNKKFPDLIRAARKNLPDNCIDTNTNGDRLTPEMVSKMFEAGITFVYANMYDGPEQEAVFKAVFEDAKISPDRYKLRPHWEEVGDDYGLFLNNRSGMVVDPDIGLPAVAEPIVRPCYYPFSRAMVDWNGDVLICSNDWARKCVVGNVVEQSFSDVWMSEKMFEVRMKLMQSDRNHKPCATCGVNGTLSGEFGYSHLVTYYKNSGLIE